MRKELSTVKSLFKPPGVYLILKLFWGDGEGMGLLERGRNGEKGLLERGERGGGAWLVQIPDPKQV